jgi:SAM-dependent methyltransferase
MAREGALVTAIDFSPVALERAAALAKDCGVSLSCFLADSRNLPAELNDCFDIVYATIGVLCWIDNIDAWSDGVTRILAPGGRLVLVDLHPLYQMLDTLEPPVFEFPYNFDGVRTYDSQGSYANRDLPIRSVTEQSAHGLAEIVMSLVRAGLTLLDLRELLSSDFDIGGSGLECGADGRYRLRIGSGVQGAPAEPLPVLFSLVAERTK